MTFLSCVHQCTNYPKVWPKVSTGSAEKQSRNFKLSDAKISIRTPFITVEELLNKAVKIFNDDLNQILESMRGSENGEFNDSLSIEIIVDSSDEISLSMDTDECYNLLISSVGI